MEAFRQQGIIAGEDLQTWEERKAALNSATGESTNSTSAADIVELLEDSDNDGFGDPEKLIQGCEANPGVVSNGNDCMDSDPFIYPGAAEICDGK